MERANSARSWIFCCKKCTAKRTRCCRKHPEWRAKRSRSLELGWRSKRRLKSYVSRYKTSNERRTRKQSDGFDRFRALGLGEIDAGPACFAHAGDDGFKIVYYEAAPGDRVQREVL